MLICSTAVSSRTFGRTVMNFPYWSELVCFIGVAFVVHRLFTAHARSRLPPGPTGLPLLGNLLQLPTSSPWHKMTAWKDQYGPIYSLNLAGQTMIVLNSRKVCSDLLEKQSVMYSHRPRFIVASDWMSSGLHMSFMNYNDLWRRLRKVAHEGLNARAVQSYATMQEQEASILALAMLEAPDAWKDHLKRTTTAIAQTSTYGPAATHAFKVDAEKCFDQFGETLTRSTLPGSHLVDIIPALEIVPTFLARWKRQAMAFHEDNSAKFKEFMGAARHRFTTNQTDTPCIAQNLLNGQSRYNLSDKQLDWLAAVLIMGSGTSTAVMSVFILAMVLYPEVQARAQRDIDEVVGRDRLPTVADLDNLPYIAAIVQETLRWRPIAPLGLPRRCLEDNFYDGYLIPAGSLIVANVWALNRETEVYSDIDDFRPERYLSAENKEHFSFGFGRRICPGMLFANQSLSIEVATLLWALNIQPSGKLPSGSDFIDQGLVITPAPFGCKFTARSHDFELVKQLLFARASQNSLELS